MRERGECETTFCADWEVTWTEDGNVWGRKMFCSLGRAREFALKIAHENEDNLRFSIYARRYVRVDSASFMDERNEPYQVAIVSRHADIEQEG